MLVISGVSLAGAGGGGCYLSHERPSGDDGGPRIADAGRRRADAGRLHARIGWAALASLRPELRRAASVPLGALLGGTLAVWRARVGELPPAGLSAHGCPAPASTLAAVNEAAREVIVPGLVEVGIDPGPAQDALTRASLV